MASKFRSSLATRFFRLLSREHEKGAYIYSLKEAALRDLALGAALEVADAAELRRMAQNIGEAQADMLYDAADAAVVGLELSGKMKHSIFLEYLQRNTQAAASVRPACTGVTHAPKA